MTYTFDNLSPPEFEDLARDLIGRELGVRFEAFCQGPDGGIDGRHAPADRSVILQAKHYSRSTFANLGRAMKREREAIDRLMPDRYIMATTQRLSPPNKTKLASIIGSTLRSQGDIFGPDDLNGLLRKYPEIVRAHIKLWLSSAVVLDRIIHAATYFFTTMSRDEVAAKVRVYVPNPSFPEAQQKLEDTHVLIVSGPPGVGKTTLAEMLSYTYIAKDWEFVALRSLDDGFKTIVDTKPQIFFFDDFLGKVRLDERALSSKETEIAKFIKRVRASKNARFILTTRTHIFHEARSVSEHLGDRRLDITQYSLDVGVYTRQIKAHILYNHLYVAGLPISYVRALWDAGAIPTIIDHKNYNPRTIYDMTESVFVQDIEARDYPAAFIDTLDRPELLWDKAFRKHIAPRCQHLLIALFFCSEYGAEIGELQSAFEPVHSSLCAKHRIQSGLKDFEEALKIVEGGFVAIRGGQVSFVNPSLRDYLTAYLKDAELLADLAKDAVKADWAEAIWKQAKTVRPPAPLSTIAKNLLSVAKHFDSLPVMSLSPDGSGSYRYCDISMSDRLELLIEWWGVSQDPHYGQLCIGLTRATPVGFSPYRDGKKLIAIASALRTTDEVLSASAQEVADLIELKVVELLAKGSAWPDDLERIYEEIDKVSGTVSATVIQAAHDAVFRQVEDIADFSPSIDSESTLRDQMTSLERLAARAGVDPAALADAVSVMNARISAISEVAEEASTPASPVKPPWRKKRFSDAALADLFAPLVDSADDPEPRSKSILGIECEDLF